MRLPVAVVLAGLLAVLPFGACDCDGVPGGNEGEGEGEGDANGDAGFIGDSGVPVACIDHLESIAIDPPTQQVSLDGTTAAPLTFTATGTLDDGSTLDLDEGDLGWTATRPADDGDPGTIAAGTYDPNPLLGGSVTITATDGCASGEATVVFTVNATLGTPVNAADWQATPVTTGPVPEIVYPSDQTRFPRNIFQTLFQWRPEGLEEFRLTFEGAGSTVTVFTDGAHPLCPAGDAACFEADATAWALIAGGNAGGTVTWTVDSLDRSTTPPTVRRGASITLGFSARDVKGAIFYWSTTSAGIRRANVGDAAPEDYITGKPGTLYALEGQVKCVACHVVSRDGRKLAAPVETTARSKSLWIMDVTRQAPPIPRVTEVADTDGHGFATFSPDTSLVMSAWGGLLWLVDAATGAYVADVDLAGGEGTHPDWSPDGTQVAYATEKGDAPGAAAIALLPSTGATTFGPPETLVAQQGDRTNLFPMFSPDGEWLAFTRGRGGHGDDQMQLFVVDPNGPRPGTPVELTNANRVVSNAVTDGLHQNAAPTWAPPGDLYWIAFNSKRPYGLVDEQGGTQQIWVAAVDPAQLEAGIVDPSFPAFRLQFQGLEEDNHRAFWVLDVRDEPPPVDAGPGLPDAGDPPDSGPPPACLTSGAECDPVFDTCCDTAERCLTFDDGLTYTCSVFVGG